MKTFARYLLGFAILANLAWVPVHVYRGEPNDAAFTLLLCVVLTLLLQSGDRDEK